MVAPARAGEAAGVTLTALVTLAGVGVAVSGTVLEVLQLGGMGTGAGINAILTAIALALAVAAAGRLDQGPAQSGGLAGPRPR